MTDQNSPPHFDNGLFFRHLAILVAGFIAGMVAVYLFEGIHFDFSGELERAQELGIVSPTILAGYAKKRDIVNYMAIMGFPTLFAVGAWLVWARGERRSALAAMFPPAEAPAAKGRGWFWGLVAVAGLYLVVSFDVNSFYQPSYNDYTLAWPFLGEEGENLAWVQSLLNGGVYGKDIHCLYGPMLIYPLVWLMKLTGATVVKARLYTYLLDLVAYGIIVAFLHRTFRAGAMAAFAAAVYFFVFGQSPMHLLAPNMTYLRVALGLVPLLLVYLYEERREKALLVAAGVVLGQSILFSQEVGICATLATFAMLVAMRRPEGGVGGFFRDGAFWLGGLVASLLPLLLYFAGKGALGAFVDNLTVHPRLLGLGFTALPFPDLRRFFSSPSLVLLSYWVIFVYIGAALYLLPMLILGRRDKETLLRCALLLFGAVLYRAALARSDEYHASFVSPPAFFLCFLFLDGALAGMKKGIARPMLAARLALSALIIGSLVLLTVTSPFANIWTEGGYYLQMFSTKLTPRNYGTSVPQVPRAGVRFDPQTADSIARIDTFLTRYTRPGDYVYFFPNEAAYYFLFDRQNPTRYVISYFAVTRDQRLELIADLERKRPEYVVYSRNTWRVDDIPETVQVPEICDYLLKTYHPVEDTGNLVFLKRNAS